MDEMEVDEKPVKTLKSKDDIENMKVAEIFRKHRDLKGEVHRQKLEHEYFDKMLFYLECEMSLLIYGVGSKRTLLQIFLEKYVYHEYPSMVVRGYHSGLMPKTILNDIVDYIREEVDLKPKSKN